MSVLLFSDLHLHPHRGKVERLEDCLRCLDWVFDVAEERGVRDILFGGDLFHDRKRIEVYTYYRAFEVLERRMASGKQRLWLLLGNHDLWFSEKTSVNSVTPLSALPNVNVIDRPCRHQIDGHAWDFIPYTHNPPATIEELRQMPGEPEYGLGHVAVDGAILHGSTLSDVVIEHDGDMTKVDSGVFSGYRNVFLGHYHAEQRLQNGVEYIGSPLQLSFGEAFQQKHAILFDGDTGEKTYVVNEFSPKHFLISQDEIGKYDLKGNFVKLYVDDISSTDLVDLKQEVQTIAAVGSLEIKAKKTKIAESVVSDATAILRDSEEMLSEWTKQRPFEGDASKLLSIGQRICQSHN